MLSFHLQLLVDVPTVAKWRLDTTSRIRREMTVILPLFLLPMFFAVAEQVRVLFSLFQLVV